MGSRNSVAVEERIEWTPEDKDIQSHHSPIKHGFYFCLNVDRVEYNGLKVVTCHTKTRYVVCKYCFFKFRVKEKRALYPPESRLPVRPTMVEGVCHHMEQHLVPGIEHNSTIRFRRI